MQQGRLTAACGVCARRRSSASAMGGEIGRIRPTKVFERAGESRMTPPASSISSQVRPRISFLRLSPLIDAWDIPVFPSCVTRTRLFYVTPFVLAHMVRTRSANLRSSSGLSSEHSGSVSTCPSRIRCQAATGSWTKSRQWETQRTLFSSARATMCPPTKVDGVWPFNDAWLRTSL